MVTKTYLPSYLCDSSDVSDSTDSNDRSDNSDSSDSSDSSDQNTFCTEKKKLLLQTNKKIKNKTFFSKNSFFINNNVFSPKKLVSPTNFSFYQKKKKLQKNS